MPRFSQATRPYAVSSPLGDDVLLLERFRGTERLSGLFHFTIDVLVELGTTVAFESLLGQTVSVRVTMGNNLSRYFHGHISRLTQAGPVIGGDSSILFHRFQAEVVPKLWFLTRGTRSRIFQTHSVPDILKQVLAGLDVAWEIQGTFASRDYCSQYRESDFAFASRLMEEEGLYYYFRHTNGGHTMVVANTPQSHSAVSGDAPLIYEAMQGGVRPEDRIHSWVKSQELRAGKLSLWDHSFELPGQNLEAKANTQETVVVGRATHKLKIAGNDSYELYDYPGAYAQRFDGIAPGGGDRAADIQKIFQDNARTAGIRMQQEAARTISIHAESTCAQISAGHSFTLDRHEDGNGKYVITSVVHSASLEGAYSHGTGVPEYTNEFETIPFALPYRPQRTTHRPIIHGTQTAVVVGPSGEEIFTDKYGRVKVQLNWDRDGKTNADSSCWVRVGTVWAGQQWGSIHIPRMGQEVIVAFEEGDPDRPIIVGSVYNAANMPPYTLPDERTKSTLKSRSSLKGTAENFNELRFEDKKGSEEIYLHAEKNFVRIVENDDLQEIGLVKKDKGDQSITIHNNSEFIVGYPGEQGAKPTDGSQFSYVWNNREETIGNGTSDAKDGSHLLSIWNNQESFIGYGKGQAKDGSQITEIWKDRTVTLDTGDDTLQLKKGTREVKIDMGNDTLTIKMGNQTTKLDLGKSSTEAMQGIELKVGESSVTIDQTGVTIKGLMVKIEGTVQAEFKGLMTNVSATAMLQAKGAITMIG